MTDELRDYGTGSYIIEFVSGGPKHYAYKIWSTREQKEIIVIKVKGFSINDDVSALVNFEALKRKVHAFVQKGERQETTVRIQRIEKTSDRKIVTVIRGKLHRVTFDKRVILPDFTTIPYGYRTA